MNWPLLSAAWLEWSPERWLPCHIPDPVTIPLASTLPRKPELKVAGGSQWRGPVTDGVDNGTGAAAPVGVEAEALCAPAYRARVIPKAIAPMAATKQNGFFIFRSSPSGFTLQNNRVTVCRRPRIRMLSR